MKIFLHAGNDFMIRKKDVVAVFDLDRTSAHKVTRDFLRAAQKNGQIVNMTDDVPRSFIVVDSGGKTKVCLSQLSPATLNERTE